MQFYTPRTRLLKTSKEYFRFTLKAVKNKSKIKNKCQISITT